MSERVDNFARFAAEKLKRSSRDDELDKAKRHLELWFSDINNIVSSEGVSERYLKVSIQGPTYKIQVLDDSLTFVFSRKNIEVSYVSSDGENYSETDTIVYNQGILMSQTFNIIFTDALFEKYLEWLKRTLRTFVEDL